jgi:folylpolyglutamate synthase/dihydropteroate synthase
MAALAARMRRVQPDARVAALFSMMRDKDVASVYRLVAGFADEVHFIPLGGRYPRALSREELDAARSASASPSPGGNPGDPVQGGRPVRPFPERRPLGELPLEAAALAEFLRAGPGKPDIVVACGSLYFLGALIPLLVPLYPGLGWFRQFEGES